jgi:thymidylate synthase
MQREWYGEVVRSVLDNGTDKVNKRTSNTVRTHRGAVSLTIEPYGLVPTSAVRRLRPSLAAAEVAWELSGSQDVRELQKLGCHFWDKFVGPDQVLAASYGFRMRHLFRRAGKGQIATAIAGLSEDRSNRQMVVSLWDPAHDGLWEQEYATEGRSGYYYDTTPCPIAFTCHIQDSAFNSSMLIRSSDVVLGFPYDVMAHALRCAAMAASLGTEVGFLTFTLADAHIYNRHLAEVREIAHLANPKIASAASFPSVPLPGYDVDAIIKNAAGYVSEVRRLEALTRWPEFDPKLEVVV